MKTLSKHQMLVQGGEKSVGNCIAASAGFAIAAAAMITFTGGLAAFAITYGSYVLAVDSVIAYC